MPRRSSGLTTDNPFSLAFIVEGILDLADAEAYDGRDSDLDVLKTTIQPLLIRALDGSAGPLSAPGSVGISPYPPSAYLTQLVFRNLRRCQDVGARLPDAVVKSVRDWARVEVNRHIALLSTGSRNADPLELAYAIVLSSSASLDERTSPEEKSLLREALRLFFASQQNGLWRQSQPIFHYSNVGNAHCFDYELLTQLLNCRPLQEELLSYLSELRASALLLERTSFDLGPSGIGRAVGWASGHHPQIEGPESWSTACVYDFAFSLDRLLAEATRRALFREVRAVYTPPDDASRPIRAPADFAPLFLDAEVNDGSQTQSLKQVLLHSFVIPIERERERVARGGSMQRTTPMSAILYGPPGTSKTQLAKLISDYLGWPLLTLDPSYLVQDGMENLYARANRIFAMLELAEQTVVLLDEFDEMGRSREDAGDVLSRFLTTSMLPKLAAINDSRKIVFLLATNHVETFDEAFSRGGRFDMKVPVMPPTAEAKLAHPPWADTFRKAMSGMDEASVGVVNEHLGALTFVETEQLVMKLADGAVDPLAEITVAAQHSILNGGDGRWRKACEHERSHVRIPATRSH
jgi:hypothetical protein